MKTKFATDPQSAGKTMMITSKPNTFLCDIYRPDPNGYTTLDGVKVVCLMTGNAASTAEETIARCAELCGDERGYAHHPVLYIEAHECCSTCGGHGKLPKMRGKRRVPYAFVPCKACGERGTWPAGKIVTVLNRTAA